MALTVLPISHSNFSPYDAIATSASRMRFSPRSRPRGSYHSCRVCAPPPVPVITTFTPTRGPIRTVVTITGYGFTGTTRVSFGTVDAITYSVDSNTQITATVPDGAITAPITVVAPGGTADSGDKKFHVTP